MGSSFGSYSFLASLLLVFIFISPSIAGHHHHHAKKAIGNKLEQICDATIHSRSCLKLLKSDHRTASADLHGLIDISIDLAKSKAKEINRMLRLLIENTTNNELKKRYLLCSKNYHNARRDLERAEKYLHSGDYQHVAVEAIDASEEASDCKGHFSDSSVEPSPNFSKGNQDFEFRCNIVAVATNYLPRKS